MREPGLDLCIKEKTNWILHQIPEHCCRGQEIAKCFNCSCSLRPMLLQASNCPCLNMCFWLFQSQPSALLTVALNSPASVCGQCPCLPPPLPPARRPPLPQFSRPGRPAWDHRPVAGDRPPLPAVQLYTPSPIDPPLLPSAQLAREELLAGRDSWCLSLTREML
jgi:hypothetical protein